MSHRTDGRFFQVRSPVLAQDLRTLGPRCELIQFRESLSVDDHLILSNFLRENLRIGLRIFGGFSDAFLLKPYEGIARLEIDMFAGSNPTVFRLLPRSLTSLKIVSPVPPAVDLNVLAELDHLSDLHVFARTKNATVLPTLTKLRRLSLGKVSAGDLAVLGRLPSLEGLCLRGAAVPVNALPSSLHNLKTLDLINFRKTASVETLSSFPALERIRIEEMPLLTHLPSLASLARLKRVWLENLRNLHDIRPAAEAAQLEWLACMRMPQLA